MVTPGYPAYRNILTALGITPVMIPSAAEHRYQPTPDLLEALDGPLDGLVMASPSNPAGTMLDPDRMRALLAYCRGRGIRVVSDEIYHGITYGVMQASALGFGDEAIVVNSFSKYFSMTGWRLGWMIVPPELVRAVECLSQNLFISSPSLSQHAAVAAFDCHEELEANVARYRRNREVLLNELPAAGIGDLAPADGAFYIYAGVSRFTNDSVEFCNRMLSDIGVACTPGSRLRCRPRHGDGAPVVRRFDAGDGRGLCTSADLAGLIGSALRPVPPAPPRRLRVLGHGHRGRRSLLRRRVALEPDHAFIGHDLDHKSRRGGLVIVRRSHLRIRRVLRLLFGLGNRFVRRA